MNARILFFCLIAALTLCAHAADAPPTLWAGTAKVEITPPAAQAVNLSGQPLQPREPLFARVLVLKDERTSVAIVAADLIVFASPKVVAEAKAKWGVDHVILSATHTHAAMAPRGLLIKPPASPDWTRSPNGPASSVNWLRLSEDPWYAATETKVIAAIGTAMKALFPARLVAGKGAFENAYMAHNRRLVRPGGGVTALWENPDRRPTQPVDPTVGVIRVEDLTGKPASVDDLGTATSETGDTSHLVQWYFGTNQSVLFTNGKVSGVELDIKASQERIHHIMDSAKAVEGSSGQMIQPTQQ